MAAHQSGKVIHLKSYQGLEVFTRNQVEKLTNFLLIKFLTKATITRCNLSPRFFCIDSTLLGELEAIRYESMSLNRIVADKSHRVIVD